MESVAREQGPASSNNSSSTLPHTNLLSFFKIQTVIKSHPSTPGGLKLGHFLLFGCFFPFLSLFKPIIL